MRFIFQRKDRTLPLLAIGVLLASFFMLAIAPAHAATPTVNNTASNLCTNALTCNITLTVATTGDVVAVMAQIENTGTSGTLYTITGVTSTGVSGGFSEILSVNAQCTASAGFCNGVGGQPEWMFADAWVGVATTSGAITIIVTGSSSSSSTSGGQAYDISNSATSPAHYGAGSCNAVSGNDCGNPIVITTAPSSPLVASVYLTGAATIGAGLSSTPPATWVYVGTGNGQKLGGGYAPNTLVPPTSYPINLNGGSGLNTGYALVGLTFNSAAAVTVTTVVNTACLGACSGGQNGTAQYIPATVFNLHFYSSQNLAAAAQVDNVTVKIANVHINSATGTFFVLVYSTSGIPTGGNPYALVKTVAVTVSNGTGNFFVHTNPQANICASCYYAVGIMANTTKSNSAGVTGTGISVYETSQSGLTEYKFSVGSGTPPASFFSSTIQVPRDFIYIHTTFAVTTATTTSTLTLSGLVTSTTTTTSTSTVTTIDSTFFTQNANFPFMVLILLLPTGLFLGITRNLSGGLVGLLIGAVIGAFTGVIPSWIFTGLVIAIVASAFMIQRSSRNG